MRKLYSGFWVGVTIVLSVIFVVLGFPIFHDNLGFPGSVLVTFVGVVIIWLIYFVRAWIFTNFGSDRREDDPQRKYRKKS